MLLVKSIKHLFIARIISKIIILLLFVLMYQNSVAKEKIKLAVVDFKPVNVPAYYATIVKADIEGLLVQSKDFVVVERNHVEIIFQEMQLIKRGCEETSCLVDAGKVLSADIIITGIVAAMGEGKKITVKIVDVRTSEIISVISVDFKDDKDIRKAAEMAGKGVARDIRKFDGTGGVNKEEYRFYFSGGFNYVIPYGSLRKLLENGYGFNIHVGIEYNNFLFGLESGLILFNAKGDYDKDIYSPIIMLSGSQSNWVYLHNRKIYYYSAKFFPVMVGTGYQIKFFNFAITPYIGIGSNISIKNYKIFYYGFLKGKESIDIDSLLKTQINVYYAIHSSIKLQITVCHNSMLDGTKYLPYVELKTGTILFF